MFRAIARACGRALDSTDKTVEAHLILFVLVVLTLLGLSAYSVIVLGQHFDAKDFGASAGWIFGGCGAAAWGQGMQRRAQGDPQPPSPPDGASR